MRNLLALAGFGLLFGAAAQAGVVDGESRQKPEEFFANPANPRADAFAASGSLYCGIAGIDVTAQVVVEEDALLTAAHFFFDPATQRLRGGLEGCFWSPFFGPFANQRVKLKIETLRIYSNESTGSSLRFLYSRDWSQDLAMVRLDFPRNIKPNIKPYALDTKTAEEPEKGFFMLSAVDGGRKTSHDFSPALQSCGSREFDMPWSFSAALPVMYTDCDVQNPGPSGSALLRKNGDQLVVAAILSGFYGKKGLSGPYSKDGNSSAFIALSAKAQKWIANYLSAIR